MTTGTANPMTMDTKAKITIELNIEEAHELLFWACQTGRINIVRELSTKKGIEFSHKKYECLKIAQKYNQNIVCSFLMSFFH